jgi:hypothetical protein
MNLEHVAYHRHPKNVNEANIVAGGTLSMDNFFLLVRQITPGRRYSATAAELGLPELIPVKPDFSHKFNERLENY